MNKIYYIIILLLLTNICLGQKRYNNLKISQSECIENQDKDIGDTRLLNYNFSSGNNTISYTIKRNCCAEFKPIIKVLHDTIIIENKDISEETCFCDCCFSLNITFNYSKNIDYFFIDKKQVFSNQDSLNSYYILQKIIKTRIEDYHRQIFKLKVKDLNKIDLHAKYKLKYEIIHNKRIVYGQGGVKIDSIEKSEYIVSDSIHDGKSIILQLIPAKNHSDAINLIDNKSDYWGSKIVGLLEHYNQIISHDGFSLFKDLKDFKLKPLFETVSYYKLFITLGDKNIVLTDTYSFPCNEGDSMCTVKCFQYYEKIE